MFEATLNAELKSLWVAGFALHVLHAKSKRPVKMGWAKSARGTFEGFILDCEKYTKKAGLLPNFGVRLGGVSGGIYCLDVDIKAEEGTKAHAHAVLEAQAVLADFFGGAGGAGKEKIDAPWASCPTVLSGRGGGSRHIYFRVNLELEKETKLGNATLARSKNEVKVLITGAGAPSVKDKRELSVAELESGYRIRPAWEISLCGNGRQVVIPPSIHPDTGARYTWLEGIRPTCAADIPAMACKGLVMAPKAQESIPTPLAPSVAASEVSWAAIAPKIDPGVRQAIETGEGVGDRSAYMLTACRALLAAGIPRGEVVSVLSDSRYFLGRAAIEHANGSLSGARRWVDNYVVGKVLEGAFASGDALESTTNAEIATGVERKRVGALDFTGAELMAPRRGRARDAEGFLVTSGRDPQRLANVENVRHALSLQGYDFGFESFTSRWAMRAGPIFDQAVADDDAGITCVCGETYLLVDDRVVCLLLAEIHRAYDFSVTKATAFEAIEIEMSQGAFSPLRDWLGTLVWDGVPRLDRIFTDYFKADPTFLAGDKRRASYLATLARVLLLGLVGRAHKPGLDFQTVVILEGAQGIGKSLGLQALAGPGLFNDAFINLRDKDAVLGLQGAWLYELGELTALRGQDKDLIKAFVSRSVDRIRPPYGRSVVSYPRQTVFVGTTNDREYLTDETGNRRFMPVALSSVDVGGIARDREQLVAEAVSLWVMGESPTTEADHWAVVTELNAVRLDTTIMPLEPLTEWLDRHPDLASGPLTLTALCQIGGPFEGIDPVRDQSFARAAGRALRALGFEKRKGKNSNTWVKTGV